MKKVNLSNFILCISILFFSASAYSWVPDPEPKPNPAPTPCNTDCTQGPDPTTRSVEANRGPFSISSVSVPRSVHGFGGGTIFYPHGTTGSLGAIAIIPGFLNPEWVMRDWGKRIASHGFVVITVGTNALSDQPDRRATQLNYALDHVVNESLSGNSPISGMVDPERLGVIGASMGGGGTLKLTSDRTISAAIPMVPWYLGRNNFNAISTPTMVIGCEHDTIAPVAFHSIPFYNEIPDSTQKAYLEINNGSHICVAGILNGGLLGKYAVSWMKRFVDNDTRYNQFLCGPNHTSEYAVSDYRDNCEY